MIDGTTQTELTLGLLQIPVGLDVSNGGGIFLMCSLSNMAYYAISITKLEVNDKLKVLHQGSSKHSVKTMSL